MQQEREAGWQCILTHPCPRSLPFFERPPPGAAAAFQRREAELAPGGMSALVTRGTLSSAGCVWAEQGAGMRARTASGGWGAVPKQTNLRFASLPEPAHG